MVPDRLGFPEALEGCPLREHLDAYHYGPYEEPDVLRGGPRRTPCSDWPRFRGKRQDLLAIFARWGRVGRLGFVEADGIKQCDVVQVAAVRKSEEADRQILDERGPNSLEDVLADGSSRHLPSGPLLLDLSLLPGEQLVLGTADRASFYHQFEASASRTRRTPVGAPLWGRELADLLPGAGLRADCRYYGCFRGLGMGDHAAVDFALNGHEKLLVDFGVLTPSRWVRGDRPTPGGAELVEVIIDDLVVAVKVPRYARVGDLHRRDRADLDIFQRAREAYAVGRMPGAPDKDRCGESTLTVGGIEIDGRTGVGGVPRDRLLPLSFLSMRAAALPEITTEFAEILLGCWTAGFLPRRPLLVIFSELYGCRNPDRKAGIRLPRRAAAELALAAALAPLAAVELRAPYIPDVFSTDASPSGGGITVARRCLPRAAADVAWRDRNRRGGYSRLEFPEMERAMAFGLAGEVDPTFCTEDWNELKRSSPPRPVAQS